MNKKLILCRHAQAAPSEMGKSDFERNLTAEGKEQATRVGKQLAGKNLEINLVLTSPATRAKQTAHLINAELQLPEVKEETQIYEAGPSTLLALVTNLPVKVTTVLFVGHNPSLSQLAVYLTGNHIDLGTAGFVMLDLATENWGLVSGGTANLIS